MYAILFRNSYGMVVTFCGFMAYIVMLLYHYIVSTATGTGKQNLDLTQVEDGADEKMFYKQIIVMPLILWILILAPFARNHKLR